MAIYWCLIPLNSIQRSYIPYFCSIPLYSTQTTETILRYSTQFHSKIMLDSTQSNSISLTSTQHCSLTTDSFFVYVFITEQRIHEKEISIPILYEIIALQFVFSVSEKNVKTLNHLVSGVLSWTNMPLGYLGVTLNNDCSRKWAKLLNH